MAFTSTIESTIPETRGTKKLMHGTFTNNSSSTGGDIDTGLAICEKIVLQQKASAVVADSPVVNETLPVSGSAVTIVTTADAVGFWYAEGV